MSESPLEDCLDGDFYPHPSTPGSVGSEAADLFLDQSFSAASPEAHEPQAQEPSSGADFLSPGGLAPPASVGVEQPVARDSGPPTGGLATPALAALPGVTTPSGGLAPPPTVAFGPPPAGPSQQLAGGASNWGLIFQPHGFN